MEVKDIQGHWAMEEKGSLLIELELRAVLPQGRRDIRTGMAAWLVSKETGKSWRAAQAFVPTYLPWALKRSRTL